MLLSALKSQTVAANSFGSPGEIRFAEYVETSVVVMTDTFSSIPRDASRGRLLHLTPHSIRAVCATRGRLRIELVSWTSIEDVRGDDRELPADRGAGARGGAGGTSRLDIPSSSP